MRKKAFCVRSRLPPLLKLQIEFLKV